MTTPSIGRTATLAYGYTMADVDRLTRAGISRAWGRHWVDQNDAYEEAWGAIVEQIYSSTQPPTAHDLLKAGGDAINFVAHNRRRDAGVAADGTDSVGFRKYWHIANPTDGFSESLIERMALAQVLSLLTDEQYEAVAAVAVYENQQRAADAIGVSRPLLQYRLKQARDKIKRHWYAPETPRRPIDIEANQSCRRGHPRPEDGFITTKGKWGCRRCNRMHSRISRAGVSQSREVRELREG